MIKPWIFEFANAGQIPGEPLYEWYFGLWEQAERIGFEGVFFSEHHFRPIYTTPSPNLLIAALAQRTRRMRLGVMGAVLPLHAPWRVAEEFAMLDHLTHGRLEIGYSSGIGPAETSQVGIPLDEVRPRFDAAIPLIDALLAGETVEHEGILGQFGPIALHPGPRGALAQRWTTIMGPGAAGAAAARGFKVATGFITVDKAREAFDVYRNRLGDANPDAIALRRNVLIGDSAAEAAELAAWSEASTRAEFAAHRRKAEGLAPDAPADSPLDFVFGPDEMIHGDVKSVTEQIIAQCRATGAGHMLAFTFSNIPRQAIERSYQLWEQVIPQLRKASL